MQIFGRTILKKVLIMLCLKLFTHSYHRVYKKAASRSIEYLIFRKIGGMYQGRIRDFKLGGAHLKKLRRAEGGAKIVGVFRVKNHDFTPKNHIFSNFRPPPGSAPVYQTMYSRIVNSYPKINVNITIYYHI